MRSFFGSMVLAAGLLAVPAAGQAAVVNVNYDASTIQVVQQINPTTTFWQMGNRPAGSEIRVIGWFSSGVGIAAAPFLTAADPCGAAQANAFTLFGCGDTFSNPWTLVNNDAEANGYLTRVDIDLIRGGFVFDVAEPSPGTFFSANGNTFALAANSLGVNDVITATYSRPISYQGDAPLGDVWGYLSIDLTGITSQGGYGLATQFDFVADTDPIPLPGALPLLLTAFGGLALAARRRRPAA